MQQKILLKLLPHEVDNQDIVKNVIAKSAGKKITDITGYQIQKKSIDARGKTIWISLSVLAFINEPFIDRKLPLFYFNNVSNVPKKVIVIGAGPAGLYAALQLIEDGIQPIILERGKDVRSRRRDLAILNREGIVNPESNYCFGEGGAGTYSDGKLYTRSSKRGDIDRILHLFVHFGADEKILYESHPHIGTNKLPAIITAMRQKITDCGGQFYFNKKVVDLILTNDHIKGVKCCDGDIVEANAVILATGHSARDIFEMLHAKNILIEPKPFALGVRVEHPQTLIDSVQYHCSKRDEYLPPASYSLVQQLNGRGVFSFCMCPGGIIAPAATTPGQLVVNGWSPSKRNNPYANSGMVVTVNEEDALEEFKRIKSIKSFKGEERIAGFEKSPLLMMYFQKMIEEECYSAGGGKFVAPAQRMVDFSNKKLSADLPPCSYQPGLQSAPLNEVLPPFIYECLAKGFVAFGKKMKGYFCNDAIIVATESRTSSPVRIPRNALSLAHPQIKNLYPCGEGAGYAGGIVSAAMDGVRIAKQLAEVLG